MTDLLAASKPIEYIMLATSVMGFLTGFVSLIYAFKSKQTAQRIEISVDGQLADFKALIASSSRAEGVIEGKAEERANPS